MTKADRPGRRWSVLRRRLGWLPVCLLLSACGGEGAATPGLAAENLYAVLRESRVTGAPSREQLARLQPYISDTLRALLVAADRMRGEDLRRFPDEKPSFTDGDLFSSLFEGPSSFEIAATEGGPQPPYRVHVEFAYESGGSKTSWSDVVVVVPAGTRWVVDDVVYRGDWEFAAQGSLRSALELALGQETPAP